MIRPYTIEWPLAHLERNPMRNIELKARLADRAKAIDACAGLGAMPQGDLHQIDTYFNVPNGRLKYRAITPGDDYLVAYHRPDIAAAKACDYTICPASEAVRDLLAETLGVVAIVDKVRTLYLWENVRIHLDLVENLGEFIEFEAVLDGERYDDADGHEKLKRLCTAFHIAGADIEARSYIDLILAASQRT